MATSYVDGTRARAVAARAILAGMKEARNKAFSALAAIERQQRSATQRLQKTLEKIDDDFNIPDDLPPDEERRLLVDHEILSDVLGDVGELESLTGDFAYDLDLSEALKEVDERIKEAMRILDKANRAAGNIGIVL